MKVKVTFEIGDVVTHKASYNSLVIIGIAETGKKITCRYFAENIGRYLEETFIPEELTIKEIDSRTNITAKPAEKKMY